MGIKLFRISETCTNSQPPEPDPYDYKILSVEAIGDWTVALIHYPACNTYKGNKILVYKGNKVNELQQMNLIDPHFLQDRLSPFIRFPANSQGMECAKLFCNTIKT